jgi:adenine phosphoribosyltransferase
MDLYNYIADVPNFPKPGILFKDITPLWQDARALQFATAALYELVGGQQVDKVVAMESRGFILGAPLAHELQAGFVPVRKPGKLPRTVRQQRYALEYGTDVLEIHEDAIIPGDRVLVHDDVLATGGTAQAVKQLVEALGGEIVQFNFLMELQALEGRKKLPGYPVKALLTY